jgi:glycosyltransferase involved in cell wall biosynthesis
VHCLTNREADHIRALVPEARCEVIPNAVAVNPETLGSDRRMAFAERFPLLKGKRIVLYLSRIHRIKGLELLIPSFARVVQRFPEAHLVVAGPDEGGYKREVERMIEVRGLGGGVTFTGLLDSRDKLAAFSLAEVFVLPSYSEGLPVVVLEAMACGKPVVITDECNLTDEIRGTGAGLVVETTAEAVAEGIEAVLANSGRAHAMGEAGRKLAASRFSLETVSGRMVELFEEIVAVRKVRS